MTREEFKNWVDEPEDNVQDTVDTLFEYVRQLQKENEFIEQQNTVLQARIKELEEKPNCCTYHSDNLPIPDKCGHCDYLDCTHFPKEQL